MNDRDIIIIGAGPAGLAFARSLAGSGLSITLVERSPLAALTDPAFDGREIALTHRSQRILGELDAWDRIPADEVAPMHKALVMNGGSSASLTFGPDADGTPLGMLVPNHLIRRALWQSVEAAGGAEILTGVAVTSVGTADDGASVELADGRMLRASLVVAADTRFSETRRQLGIAARMLDFGKTMLVARVAHQVPHDGTATEWFGHGQTVAMLPLNGNVSSVVLTLPASRIAGLMAMEEEAFNAEVTCRTASRWGALRLVGSRHAYPLVATYADRFVAPRFALVGDAAVGMHPVTAHGFNLGLSSAHRLGGEIRNSLSHGRNAADPAGLLRYERAHRAASWPLFTATNAIATLYTDDSAPARLLRGAVMRLGSTLAPARRLITAQLMQAAGP